jgi:hypothetical protein
MYIQRLTSEETLFNVWHAISELQDHVTRQRIGLQQLKLEIKLNSLLNDQMVSLEDWATLERDHVSSLVGAISDLEANTLRLPATGGTKVYILLLANIYGNEISEDHLVIIYNFSSYRRTQNL